MAETWEYTYVQVQQQAVIDLPAGLNAVGSIGWEAIGVAPTDPVLGINQLVVILRRRTIGPADPEDPAAGWKPDPLERADHRYWDGLRWTEQTSRGGQVVIDYPTLTPLPAGFSTKTPTPVR